MNVIAPAVDVAIAPDDEVCSNGGMTGEIDSMTT